MKHDLAAHSTTSITDGHWLSFITTETSTTIPQTKRPIPYSHSPPPSALRYSDRRLRWLILTILAFLVITGWFPSSVDANCRRSPNSPPRCCRGRNVDCYEHVTQEVPDLTRQRYSPVQSHYYRRRRSLSYSTSAYFLHPTSSSSPTSSRWPSKRSKLCYCDERCIQLNDCCDDYIENCRVQKLDCQVSAWSGWSACENKCGPQWRYRNRTIIQNATNGGQYCPVLSERKECESVSCSSRRVERSWPRMLSFLHKAKSEVAHLLPVRGNVLQATRLFDMRWDERRKLYLGRLFKANKTEQPEPDPYCVTFEITYSKHSCRSNQMLWQLMHARTSAQNRYPNNPTVTLSKFSRPSTYGSSSSSLYHHNQHNNQFHPALSPNVAALWFPVWLSHAHLLRPSQRICVTCYPAYMKPEAAYRCPGTGMFDMETRWRALGTSDCQGRFRMITGPRQDCTCASDLYSFVFV